MVFHKKMQNYDFKSGPSNVISSQEKLDVDFLSLFFLKGNKGIVSEIER